MMSRARSLTLSPEVAKFIRDNYPIVKKRTALWFFSNELRNNLNQNLNHVKPAVGAAQLSVDKDDTSATSCPVSPSSNTSLAPTGELPSNQTDKWKLVPPKISRNKMLNIWKKMDPESKRRYFNMAEFDDLRYKEQKSHWVAEVSALLIRHHATVDTISENAPTCDQLQREFLNSLDRLHKSYEQMIQYESTKELYKDAIRKVERYESRLSPEELLSAVPKSQRSVLVRPRRPACAFVLYVQANAARLRAKLKEDKRERKSSDTLMTIGAQEWSKLDRQTRQIYEDKYDELKLNYDQAMDEFREENLKLEESCLEQASREKRAFRRSLRKRFRDRSVLPLSIRNAFNFFVMEHKDVPLTELTDIWRTLPLDRRLKYTKMNQDDVERYERERRIYNQLTQALEDIISKKSKLLSGGAGGGGGGESSGRSSASE